MVKKEKKPKKPSKKWEKYVIEKNKVISKEKSCPKCGPSIFLGKHKDRLHCGKCGYTEFTK